MSMLILTCPICGVVIDATEDIDFRYDPLTLNGGTHAEWHRLREEDNDRFKIHYDTKNNCETCLTLVAKKGTWRLEGKPYCDDHIFLQT